MEANKCDINHLDADVPLPPRKRLLAGLKRRNDGSTSSTVSQFDWQLCEHLKTHGGKSPEEIVEAARSAAEAVVKVAKAARAAAEEKAVVAAEAIAAAKRALDLVYSEEMDSDGECVKTNKMKRHGSGHMLHNKKQRVDADEEVAHNLHRVINSSPRVITWNSSSSELGSYEYRRLMRSSRYRKLMRSSCSLEKLKYYYGGKMDDVDHFIYDQWD